MASGRVRSRASGVSLNVDADGLDRTAKEFRDIRRRVKRELVTLETQAAEQEILPEAKRNAGGQKIAGESLGSHLVVRKAQSGPYLTTNLRGIRARAAGLKEFGGTVRTPIVPNANRHTRSGRPPALVINGQLRSSVRTARHYRARHYMQDAAEEQIGAFGTRVRDGVVEFFRAGPFEIS